MDVAGARDFVAASLAGVADPHKAIRMQAYMKTDMPFYGVQKPERRPIVARLVKRFPPDSNEAYRALVLGLWDLPHREEKYMALAAARRFGEFVTPDSLSLYRRLIVEGAWWDLVDEVATHLIRSLVLDYPSETWPVVDAWIDDDDMWLRRTAIICQVGAKERTDPTRLFSFCEARAGEKDFFIRKAIGWALREYSKTDPNAVEEFVEAHGEELSGLSKREATRLLGGTGD
ncbi:MAG: DNA alkylation repair protein [Acidimicrobiia bacterium]